MRHFSETSEFRVLAGLVFVLAFFAPAFCRIDLVNAYLAVAVMVYMLSRYLTKKTRNGDLRGFKSSESLAMLFQVLYCLFSMGHLGLDPNVGFGLVSAVVAAFMFQRGALKALPPPRNSNLQIMR